MVSNHIWISNDEFNQFSKSIRFYLFNLHIHLFRMNRRSVSYENAKFDEDQPEYGSLLSDSEITHPYATVRGTGSKIPRPFDKQQNSTNFKSLNRNRKSNGMYSDAHARNYSAPGARARKERQSISEFPSSRINPGRGNQHIIGLFSKNSLFVIV